MLFTTMIGIRTFPIVLHVKSPLSILSSLLGYVQWMYYSILYKLLFHLIREIFPRFHYAPYEDCVGFMWYVWEKQLMFLILRITTEHFAFLFSKWNWHFCEWGEFSWWRRIRNDVPKYRNFSWSSSEKTFYEHSYITNNRSCHSISVLLFFVFFIQDLLHINLHCVMIEHNQLPWMLRLYNGYGNKRNCCFLTLLNSKNFLVILFTENLGFH